MPLLAEQHAAAFDNGAAGSPPLHVTGTVALIQGDALTATRRRMERRGVVLVKAVVHEQNGVHGRACTRCTLHALLPRFPNRHRSRNTSLERMHHEVQHCQHRPGGRIRSDVWHAMYTRMGRRIFLDGGPRCGWTSPPSSSQLLQLDSESERDCSLGSGCSSVAGSASGYWTCGDLKPPPGGRVSMCVWSLQHTPCMSMHAHTRHAWLVPASRQPEETTHAECHQTEAQPQA